jgi:hypothetical protein
MSKIIEVLKKYNKQEKFDLNDFKFSDSENRNRMLDGLTVESVILKNSYKNKSKKVIKRIIFAEKDDEGWKRSLIPGYMVEDLSPKRLKKLESEATKIN